MRYILYILLLISINAYSQLEGAYFSVILDKTPHVDSALATYIYYDPTGGVGGVERVIVYSELKEGFFHKYDIDKYVNVEGSNIFRLVSGEGGTLVNGVFTKWWDNITLGESEFVWSDDNVGWMGGIHGREVYTIVDFYCNNNYFNINDADNKLVRCDAFKYIQESYTYFDNAVTDTSGFHKKTTQISNGDFRCDNELTFLATYTEGGTAVDKFYSLYTQANAPLDSVSNDDTNYVEITGSATNLVESYSNKLYAKGDSISLEATFYIDQFNDSIYSFFWDRSNNCKLYGDAANISRYPDSLDIWKSYFIVDYTFNTP